MSHIVTMTGCHVPQVAALEKECFIDPWSQRSVASELDNPLALWLVWEEDGQVLGYVGSQTVLDETDMMNVAVSAQARRRGIAQALVEDLCDRLRQRGYFGIVYAFTAASGALFALFYPVLTGVTVSRSYAWNVLKWLPDWPF